jgi:hypothetical protein
MPISAIYERLRQIAREEYGDIVLSNDPDDALREFCIFVRRALQA